MLRRKFLKGAASLRAISALGSNPSHGAEDPTVPTRSIPEIAGPDKNTRTPAFKMPAGAIDTHCHIFGPAAEYPFSLARPYTPPEAPLSMFRALHEKIGVERAVIVNAALHGFDNRVVTDVPGCDPVRQELINNAPDRVIWGTDWPHPNVMPNDGDLVDLISLYAPEPAVRQKLLVDNPMRLFKF
jgi:predicted TIM-barrel fold metal-dependent hydrolase